eukprot:scaffold89652_cov58-Cyclotella_meneghiniana.AAC.1
MEVYDTQGQGPFSWHEQRLGEYDVVALDFCSLVGTDNPNIIHRRRWFRNIFIESIGNPGSCDAPDQIDEPYVPSESSCTPIGSESESSDSATVAVEDKDEDSSSVVAGVCGSVFVAFLATMIL